MRGMYNIHDAGNKRMGFVPFTGSNKSMPVLSNTTPSAEMPIVALPDISLFTGAEIAIIIAFLVVVIAVIAVIIYFIVRAVKNCFNVAFMARKNLVGAA